MYEFGSKAQLIIRKFCENNLSCAKIWMFEEGNNYIILSFWDISDEELIQSCLKYLGCLSILYDSLDYKRSIMLHYFKSSMVLQLILYTRS